MVTPDTSGAPLAPPSWLYLAEGKWEKQSSVDYYSRIPIYMVKRKNWPLDSWRVFFFSFALICCSQWTIRFLSRRYLRTTPLCWMTPAWLCRPICDPQRSPMRTGISGFTGRFSSQCPGSLKRLSQMVMFILKTNQHHTLTHLGETGCTVSQANEVVLMNEVNESGSKNNFLPLSKSNI